jgi:hypothetical protein
MLIIQWMMMKKKKSEMEIVYLTEKVKCKEIRME